MYSFVGGDSFESYKVSKARILAHGEPFTFLHIKSETLLIAGPPL